MSLTNNNIPHSSSQRSVTVLSAATRDLAYSNVTSKDPSPFSIRTYTQAPYAFWEAENPEAVLLSAVLERRV